LITADTSVVVAAFASWHEGHEAAIGALRRKVRLPAAPLVESYLAERFPGAPLTLPGHAHRALLSAAASAGLTGGAIYDALIAATARHAAALLLTRDRRAIATYDRIGVRYELVV
jgi:predicted nucleic acid-binding protein